MHAESHDTQGGPPILIQQMTEAPWLQAPEQGSDAHNFLVGGAIYDSSRAGILLLVQGSVSHHQQKEDAFHLAGQAGDFAVRANDEVGLGAVQVDVVCGQRVAVLPGKGLRLRNSHMPPTAAAV